MKTRSQHDSKMAFDHISQLDILWKNREEAERNILKKQYGALCHRFPILVLRSGLAQATGFFWAKAADEQQSPHAMLLKHFCEITGGSVTDSAGEFQQRINKAELADYQRMTRTILSASIWYKRFSESLLSVKAGGNDE